MICIVCPKCQIISHHHTFGPFTLCCSPNLPSGSHHTAICLCFSFIAPTEVKSYGS